MEFNGGNRMYFYEATARKSEGVFCSLPFSFSHPHNTVWMVSQYDGLRMISAGGSGKFTEYCHLSTSNPVKLLIKVPCVDYNFSITEYAFGVNSKCQGFLMLPDHKGVKIISAVSLKEMSSEPLNLFGFYADNCIVLSLREGLVSIIPINTSSDEPTLNEPLTLQTSHTTLLDICSLSELNTHSIGLLAYKDNTVQFFAYKYSVKAKDFTENLIWKINLTNCTCHKLIPLKQGLIIVAHDCLYYYRSFDTLPCSVLQLSVPSVTLAYDFLSEDAVLLGTDRLELVLVGVEYDKITCKKLCDITYPKDIKCMNGMVYISSMLDNSLLIKIEEGKAEVLDRKEHLGGIVDLALIESPEESAQLVIGANHLRNSSVHVLRREVSLKEVASIPLECLADLWSLCFDAENYLIPVSYTHLTLPTICSV
eukprot:TRINITY_DN12155_c0_g1_i1.p1 TRINITY_DN12155_c0_g1~~TRINITY_DN12155_c0_g1_i1.p1  ORF type:complete len:423 (+),score=39.35 TRINITY_DN12155_c0_g1_i1:119-1387(+)